MFAWRKPKPSDDEPLVPHGLIWQATEEPMPAEAERTHPVAAPELHSPITIPLKRTDSPPEQPAPADTPPKMGAASELLPWASMNAKDAVKRTPPFWDSNGDSKILRATSATSTCNSKPANSLKTIPTPEIRDAANQSATEDFAVKQFVAERNKELRAAWSEFTHAVAEMFANTRHAYANLRLRESMRRTREQAHIRLARGVAHISRHAQQSVADVKWPSKMRTEFLAAGSVARRLRNKTVAVFADFRNSARGLMARKVRIRIAGGSQLRTYTARLQDFRTKSHTVLNRESRLVTSLAMAGLSAILTLGLILIVGRYQPSASAGGPGVTPAHQQSEVTILTHPVAAKPSPTRDAHSVLVKTQPPVVNTALQTPVQTTAPKSSNARRPHHKPDEDYVAPDTYVYYGKKR